MNETVVYRSGSSRALAASVVVVCVVLAVTAVASDRGDPVTFVALLATIAVVAWAALWQPSVEVGPHGVVMRNIERSVHVTWPAIVDIDGRYGLRLSTQHGRFSAWAAPSPAGMDRVRSVDGAAAQLVRQRYEQLERAGHLRSGTVETDRAAVTWHWRTLAALAVPPVVLVVAHLIG